MLETSVPGVFAIGDVRCGSVKRIGGAMRSRAPVVTCATRIPGFSTGSQCIASAHIVGDAGALRDVAAQRGCNVSASSRA